MPHSTSRTVRDPLWQNVHLDAAAAAVVDTPEFQRLRRVKQLGFAHLVYPGAVHNRFLHALGVYHLTGRAIETLERKGQLDRLDDLSRRTIPEISWRPCCTTSATTPSRTRWRSWSPMPSRAITRKWPISSSSRRDPSRAGRVGSGSRPAHRRPDSRDALAPAAGTRFRITRPGQDRLPASGQPVLRRALRRRGRGAIARLAHSGAGVRVGSPSKWP